MWLPLESDSERSESSSVGRFCSPPCPYMWQMSHSWSNIASFTVPSDSHWWTHLPRYPPVVGAALPEPTAEAFNVADPLLLVRKVHLPYEGAVAEHPHDKHSELTVRSDEHSTDGKPGQQTVCWLWLHLGRHADVWRHEHLLQARHRRR